MKTQLGSKYIKSTNFEDFFPDSNNFEDGKEKQ